MLGDCPNCGRCPTCGRGGYYDWMILPAVTPLMPEYPTPSWICSDTNPFATPEPTHDGHGDDGSLMAGP